MKSLTRFFIALCACNALALISFAGTEALSQRDSKDKEVMAAPAPSCDYSWAGFYIGVNAGYGWADADTHFQPLPDPITFTDLEPITLQPDPGGVIGGGQIGYNFQWHSFILGAEADFQGSDMDGTERVSPIIDIRGGSQGAGTFLEANEKTDWFGTVRLRAGFTPFCRLLVYGTGGLAYGNVHYAATTDYLTGNAFPTSFDKTKVGWTAGGGLEYALTHRWSIKAEYLYYDLGNESSTASDFPTPFPPIQVRYNWETTAHIVRGGLNFKF